MNLLCEYTLNPVFNGIKYLPNNDKRAVVVSHEFYVCLLDVNRNSITRIGSCLNLGYIYLFEVAITQDGTKAFVI